MNLQYYPNEAYITNIGASQSKLSRTFNFSKTLIKQKKNSASSLMDVPEKNEIWKTISKSYQQDSNVRDFPVGQN